MTGIMLNALSRALLIILVLWMNGLLMVNGSGLMAHGPSHGSCFKARSSGLLAHGRDKNLARVPFVMSHEP